MDRAEQRALEAFPYEGGTKGLICEQSRPIFIQGYRQAEQDLKLTWEDIKGILHIGSEYAVLLAQSGVKTKDMDKKEVYEEVLRRFKEYKTK